MVSRGDKLLDAPLAKIGGKGLFVKELETALLENEADIAVHSMKDMQTVLPEGLEIGAVLPREDPRDAFISLKYATLAELPAGAVVGTSSLRRQAQVMSLRPDLKIVGFRGNVETRLRKLKEGIADATFLACAGLNRLGMSDHITARMPLDVMLPAVAPKIMISMRQMLAVSWTYLVIAEIVASTTGIGAVMMRGQRFLKVDEIMAGILVIGVVGLLFDFLFRWAQRVLFPYVPRGEQ